MNMVRTGVVGHPDQWKQSGYNEIHIPRKRYGLINYNYLMKLLEFNDYNSLKYSHNQWVDDALKQSSKKDLKWTQSIAVGDKTFIEKTKKLLGDKANGRQIVNSEADYELKEAQKPYGNNANKKNELSNKISWDLGFA